METLEQERPTREDRESFLEAASRVLDDVWSNATAAENGSVQEALSSLAQLGVFDFAEIGAAEFLFDLAGELGARALTAPIADAFAAASLDSKLTPELESGQLRIVAHIGQLTEKIFSIGGDGATHVLFLDPEHGIASIIEVSSSEIQPEYKHLGAADLTLGAARQLSASSEQVMQQISLLLLMQGARMAGAGRRAHNLAVEHAKQRQQFGRLIGAFGAVQQRVATCQINVTANSALLDEALAAFVINAAQTDLSVQLAVRHVAEHTTTVISGSQHTLGAIGYFDEHEMSWLFRLANADLSLLRERLRSLPDPQQLDNALLSEGTQLPSFELGEAAEALRTQVRELLSQFRTDEGFDAERVRQASTDAGYFSLSWPESEGGKAASLEEQVVLNEEMKYAGGPVDRAMSATMLIGHALLRHGTPEQRATFLPLLREGKMNFCLGYSEPDAGSDLASLRTRAERDGDDWIISGQKLWTTRAQTASHVWLAVRTDPAAKPRHSGITIFLIPMDTPGITINEHVALSGEISCTVFYDDVRVPDSTRVGEINGGWKVITDALAAERVVMGGIAATLLGHFDALLAWMREHPGKVTAVDRAAVASVAARLQAARALVLAATRAMSGENARIIGPVAAVLSGDLAEHFARVAVDVVGLPSLNSRSTTHRFDELLRLAPMYVIGGGTNDIQRGIIARSLGLPRE